MIKLCSWTTNQFWWIYLPSSPWGLPFGTWTYVLHYYRLLKSCYRANMKCKSYFIFKCFKILYLSLFLTHIFFHFQVYYCWLWGYEVNFEEFWFCDQGQHRQSHANGWGRHFKRRKVNNSLRITVEPGNSKLFEKQQKVYYCQFTIEEVIYHTTPKWI